MSGKNIKTTKHSGDPAVWWNMLPACWKMAFNEAILGREATEKSPPEDALKSLQNISVLRFSGPRAPFPNMGFELSDLAGLEQLTRLEILIVTYQQLVSLKGIERLTDLKALYLYNNSIEDLSGLEKLDDLEELYIQNNNISSLEPIRHLRSLRVLYCSGNALTTLGGLTTAHNKTLRKFQCLPNEYLPDYELVRVKKSLGIRCLGG